MYKNITRFSLYIFASLIMCAHSQAYGVGDRVFHTFEFGTFGDNQGIEILNYKYANPTFTITRAPDWQLASGRVQQSNIVTGLFPKGDFIYVKWRVNSDQETHEETVILKDILPDNMDHKRIHFNIVGRQLYVYIILQEGITLGAPKCPIKLYPDNRCIELFPERWKNF